jgi:hypothetical protein
LHWNKRKIEEKEIEEFSFHFFQAHRLVTFLFLTWNELLVVGIFLDRFAESLSTRSRRYSSRIGLFDRASRVIGLYRIYKKKKKYCYK